jgi:hypothetical protein
MADGDRFIDPGVTAWAYLAEILIDCPRCRCSATVRPTARAADGSDPPAFDDRRATCTACGYIEDWSPPTGERTIRWWTDGRDPYLGHPLMLRTSCAGHTLWAYNEAHLGLIEDFVGARHRERSHDHPGGGSLVQKLPAWMKAAKHRDEILDACTRLRARLPTAGA